MSVQKSNRKRCRSAVQSSAAVSTVTNIPVSSGSECRVSDIDQYFFTSLSNHNVKSMETLFPPQQGWEETDATLKTSHSKRKKDSSRDHSEHSLGDDSDSSTQTQGEENERSNSNGPVYWSPEMDARLTEGVVRHRAQSWARVAEFVGDGLSWIQCQNRWSKYLEPRQRGLKSGNWQPDEEERLLELVPQYKDEVKGRTDWKAIGRELGRVPKDCCDKYRYTQERQMKKGRFTAEEDALMRKRVEEWGDKGNGLWVALEKEMGRARAIIYNRWLAQRDFTSLLWTDEMDARLTKGVEQYKGEGWARVAEFMEDELSALQCSHRWNNYLEPRQRGLKNGNWQPDEEERLLELVPQYKDEVKGCTDWKAIGRELGRVPKDCCDKYRYAQTRQMKKGRFTAEEDALIRQRVEQWGDKGNGLWVALEKEMDRSGKNIRVRWHQALSKRR